MERSKMLSQDVFLMVSRIDSPKVLRGEDRIKGMDCGKVEARSMSRVQAALQAAKPPVNP